MGTVDVTVLVEVMVVVRLTVLPLIVVVAKRKRRLVTGSILQIFTR